MSTAAKIEVLVLFAQRGHTEPGEITLIKRANGNWYRVTERKVVGLTRVSNESPAETQWRVTFNDGKQTLEKIIGNSSILKVDYQSISAIYNNKKDYPNQIPDHIVQALIDKT